MQTLHKTQVANLQAAWKRNKDRVGTEMAYKCLQYVMKESSL